MSSPVPFDELARLKALSRYELLDAQQDPLFDDLVAIAAATCRTPIAHIGFLDRDRLWIKSGIGLTHQHMPRRGSFSAYAICDHGELLVIPDTHRDRRFANNPLLAHVPPIRFLAAAPLIEPSGYAIGTLAVMDYQPRGLTDAERLVLRTLAGTAIALLDSRQLVRRMQREIEERKVNEARIEAFQQQLLATNAALNVESMTDSLSSIGNRRAFEQRLSDELTRVQRSSYPLSLLMIDIDHFKQFNDTFGHPVGDQIIRQVAAVIARAVRVTDFPARLGGDEFVAILPYTPLQGARMIAERCRLAVERECWPQRPVHISVGTAQFLPGAMDATALIADADLSLRRAKQLGRNQVADLAIEAVDIAS